MLALKQKKQKTVNVPNDTLFEPIAPKGIISYVARISPSDAKFLLEMNQKNRAISKETLRKYISDMADGGWKDSASQIQISSEGNLLNGQHRLRAILSSNTSQILTVTEGVPEESLSVMDVGRGRTPADALSVIDTKNYNVAASAIKLWKTWQEGFYPIDMTTNRFRHGNQNHYLRKMSRASQIQYVLDYANTTPNLEYICDLARQTSLQYRPLSSSVIGAFLIQANEMGRNTFEMSVDFCEKLQSGAGLNESDPILVMRNRIQSWILGNEYRGFSIGYKMKILIHAWNAWVRGKKIAKRFTLKEGKMEEMLAVKEV